MTAPARPAPSDDSDLTRIADSEAARRRTGTPGEGAPHAEPQKEPRGVPFGRYRLLSELGEGGMGVVWKAWDTSLQRVVALKQLREGEKDPDRIERFLREARLAARLTHPGIVGVLDVGSIDGEPYFTTEFIEGSSLAARIQKGVEPSQAAAWALAIAEALAYAHAQGIVHRDVKPDNLLLDAEGRPRVTDFGLAKRVDPSGKRTGQTMTRTGAILGTPVYLSPEQTTGNNATVGPASDQFSLGVVLYEMLTRRTPFRGDDLRALMNSITEADPLPPSRANARVPPDLEAICLKALEKSPSGRYASMAELAADLKRFLAGEPTRARPLSAMGRLAKEARRHRRAILPVALVLLVAVSLLARALVQRARESAKRQTEQGAMHALETGRAALESAERYLYDREPRREELARRVGEAQESFQKGIEMAPQLALGHYLMGRTWALLFDDARAEACLKEAIALDPTLGPAHYRLARLYLQRAYIETHVVRSTREKGAAQRAWTDRASKELSVALAQGVSEEGALALEVAKAMRAFVEADAKGIVSTCDDALSRFASAEGREELLWLRAAGSQGKEAIEWLGRAIDLRPYFPLAFLARGTDEYDQGDYAAAASDLDRAMELGLRSPQIEYDRGTVRMVTGDLDGAIQDFDAAIAGDARFGEAFVNRGTARTWKGDAKTAIADYKEGLALLPADVDYRADVERALALAEAVESGGTEGETLNAQYTRADVALAMRDRLAAGRLFRQVATTAESAKGEWAKPFAVLSRYNLACCLARGGDTEGAFDSLRRALDAGFSDRRQMEGDEDLASLRDDPRWKELLSDPRLR